MPLTSQSRILLLICIWALSANAAHRLDYNAICRQSQEFALRGRNFSVLSAEYEVVFSLISIFKYLERGAARLASFVDLYFILSALESRLDWDILSRIAGPRKF